MSFIGIDIGTTFIKGAVLDLDARRLKHSQRVPFPAAVSSPNPFFCEFEPQTIASSVFDLISNLALQEPNCTGIVMCGQMHGLVLMNDRREILSNCLTWRDRRAFMPHPSGKGSYLDVLKKRLTAEQRKELGNELWPGSPHCFLFWLAEEGRLEPGLIPVTIPDFVLSVLCDAQPSVDITNAMADGVLNLGTLAWHREVIEALGLSPLRWPPLRRHGEVVGHLKLGSAKVPCFTPVGDYQCAVVGALVDMAELSLNISTGSQVSRLTPGLSLGDYQTRPFFDGMFLNTITHIPAGRSLNVLVDLLSELAIGQGIELQDPWLYIDREALKVADDDLEIDLGFFGGPSGDRGMLSNIRGDNLTVGHVFRAAFNRMADTYYNCALRIWPERSWRNLAFSGGLACRFEALRQAIQRRFQTNYRVAPCSEDTLLGLLALALVSSGRVKSVQQAMTELRASYQRGEAREASLRAS